MFKIFMRNRKPEVTEPEEVQVTPELLEAGEKKVQRDLEKLLTFQESKGKEEWNNFVGLAE